MIARFSGDALATEGKRILQYGLTEGWTELRKVMLERIHAQGIKAEMDNLICVTGSMQGNELLTKAFIDPGDAIIVESPTFLGALRALISMRQSFYLSGWTMNGTS
jgi:2-aminoadipate transaminase